jgi:hypothetical protein
VLGLGILVRVKVVSDVIELDAQIRAVEAGYHLEGLDGFVGPSSVYEVPR